MVLRSVLSILLAALLALASQSSAVARSHGGGTGGLVLDLCADGAAGSVVVVDARGDPVGPVHLCPDCVAGLAFALSEPAVQVRRPFRPARTAALGAEPSFHPTHPPAPPARGPPFLA